jgi:hypothetical protein
MPGQAGIGAKVVNNGKGRLVLTAFKPQVCPLAASSSAGRPGIHEASATCMPNECTFSAVVTEALYQQHQLCVQR